MSKESCSVTSSILLKQDVFWENILVDYEKAIKQLKTEEAETRSYVYKLKILSQAISTFNLVKLLNQNSDPNLIHQLLELRCICSTSVPKEKAIKVDLAEFDLGRKNIEHMKKIKDLANRERLLIDEVNVLRIKDMTLTQMKQNVDNLMKINFPNVFSSVSGTISDEPSKIKALLKEVRCYSDELCELRKENLKNQSSVFDSIPRELAKLRRKNNGIEDKTRMKISLLKDLMSQHCLDVNRDIAKKNHCSVAEMRELVCCMQKQVIVLKQSIAAIQNLK